MKTVLAVVASLLFAVTLSAVSLSAEPVSTPKPSGYVNDFAGVLDGPTVARLAALCHEVDQKAQAQIAVVTIKSLDGKDIREYSVNLFKKWGIGPKATNRGVLILLAIQDHRYRITTGYGFDTILPEEKLSGFGKEVVPYLKRSDYGKAVSLMTIQVADAIALNANVTLTTELSEGQAQTTVPPVTALPLVTLEASSASGDSYTIFIVVGLLLVGIAAAVIWLRMRARRPPSADEVDPVTTANPTNVFMNPLNPLNSTSYWSSTDPTSSAMDTSSSFGGGDSGSSFGGGDTGGGGAGGSW